MSSSLDPVIALATKRVVYVGGLADNVTTAIIRAAFVPFGNLKSVDIPMDYTSGQHKGFCFVEFDNAEDAEEAIYNMDGSDLLGRTIKVTLAQANQVNKLSGGTNSTNNDNQAIWKSDEWFQQQTGQVNAQDVKQQEQQQQDIKVLQQEL